MMEHNPRPGDAGEGPLADTQSPPLPGTNLIENIIDIIKFLPQSRFNSWSLFSLTMNKKEIF